MKIIAGILLSLGFMSSTAQSFCTPKEVRTEIIILASAERVWDLLTNTAEYKNWHPYITEVKGELKLHKKIKVHTINKQKEPGSFSAYILEFAPAKELSWGGSLGFLFRAKHYFKIQVINDGSVLFTQGEYWRGWFGKSFGKKIYKDTYENFTVMNQNMKLVLEPMVEYQPVIIDAR